MIVCVGSFYLVFFLMMLVKDILLFYAIKESSGNYEYLVFLMVIFDMIVLLTLPLAIKASEAVC